METPDHLQCQLALTGEHLVDTIATGSVERPAPSSVGRLPWTAASRKNAAVGFRAMREFYKHVSAYLVLSDFNVLSPPAAWKSGALRNPIHVRLELVHHLLTDFASSDLIILRARSD